MEFLLKLITKWLANLAGGVKFESKDLDTILSKIIEVSKNNQAGWEKAEEVISYFNASWAGRAKWVAQTVVQLVYALAKIRGLDV